MSAVETKKIWCLPTSNLSKIYGLLCSDVIPKIQKTYTDRVETTVAQTAVTIYDQYYFRLRGNACCYFSPIYEAFDLVRRGMEFEDSTITLATDTIDIGYTYIFLNHQCEDYNKVLDENPQFERFLELRADKNPFSNAGKFKYQLVDHESYWKQLDKNAGTGAVVEKVKRVSKSHRKTQITEAMLEALYFPLAEHKLTPLEEFIWTKMKHDCDPTQWERHPNNDKVIKEINQFMVDL